MTDPSRNLTFEIYARGERDQLSQVPAVLQISNPHPPLLTGVSFNADFRNIVMDYKPSSAQDWEGVLVWLSTTSGFTPGDTNKVHDGISNSIVISKDAQGNPLESGADYYLRYSPYDTYGKAGATLSGEYKVTILQITKNMIANFSVKNADIESLSGDKIIAGSITADKYNELRNSQLLYADESLDAQKPFEIDFPILAEMTAIQAIRLSFKIKPFRAYSKATSIGGSSLETSEPESASTHIHTTATVQDTSGDRVYYSPANKSFVYFKNQGQSGGTKVVNLSSKNGHSHSINVNRINFFPNPFPTYGHIPVFYASNGILRCETGGFIETTIASGHQHFIRMIDSSVGTNLYIGNDGRFHSSAGPVSPIETASGLEAHTHQIQLSGHTHAIEYGIFEEANTPTINLYIDNGSGYGNSIGVYTTDQLEIVLTNRFSSSGWKAIKFTSDALCRIVATLELKLDITA